MATTPIAGGLAAPAPGGQTGSQRPTRFYAAWFSEQEGGAQLLGRAPTPLDDPSVTNTPLALARAALHLRPEFTPSNPVIEGDRNILDAVAARPELQADFPDVPWRVEMVDLMRIQAVQKFVYADELLPETSAPSLEELVSICMPTGQPSPPMAMAMAPDGDGFTVTSPSPNMRVIAAQTYPSLAAAAPHLPPRQVQAVTFLLGTPSSYVQVAQFQGRYFLRDGNHRAAGFLRAGITQVPAVVIESPTFQHVAPLPGMFDCETVISGQPPLVADLWDSTVAADGWQPRMQKGVCLSAKQFPIPIYM